MMRLDKFLCDRNLGTRSQVKELIRKGQIRVNGELVKTPDWKINEETDSISRCGQLLRFQKQRYYMLNKPMGVVSATRDNTSGTVLELFPEELRRGLFPAGRLDKDTEGLLLMTDDGDLAHRLLSPSRHVEKTYLVTISAPLSPLQQEMLCEGVDIGDEKLTMPARVAVESDSQIRLTICEGRFHQVKRMLHAVGNSVLALKRISFGTLRLEETLAPGEWRELTETELGELRGL